MLRRFALPLALLALWLVLARQCFAAGEDYATPAQASAEEQQALHVILLNSRTGFGPFAAWRTTMPHVIGLHWEAGAFYLKDLRNHYAADSSSFAWGTMLLKLLSGRVRIGVSALGNNGTLGLKRGSATANLFVKLDWPGTRQ